jgi:two-component system, OmpR family, manganese sensing response regulator
MDATRGEARRVVIADPHAECGETLVALMRAHGWKAYAARSGRQALVLVRRHHPTVVVTETALGDLTGAELARKVRAMGEATHIVVLTAWDTRETGFDGFFLKPAEPAAFLGKLDAF